MNRQQDLYLQRRKRWSIVRWCALCAVVLATAGCDRRDVEERTEVTLLVVYTPEAAAAAGDLEAVVAEALAETNATYENSRIPLRLRLAHLAEVEYRMTSRLDDLRRLVRPSDGFLDEVHALRDRYEADLCVLVPDKPDATINAAIMATPATAFAIVHWAHLGAPDYGLAHELGHLQGGRHSPEADIRREPLPYGHGFRGNGVRTIMANGPQRRVPYWSGPDQRYEGLVLGDDSLRNAARVLRETAVYIANFRGPQAATDFVPSSTWPVTTY